MLLVYYLISAIEMDVDVVSDGKQVVVGSIMQHIEQAGVHSGDSACSLPPYSLPAEVQDKIREQCIQLAIELEVVGLMNAQLAYQDGEVYLIEVNPRASRTVPFVSKCMAGISLESQGFTQEVIPSFFAVKEAIFPFNKFPGVDPILGPEMKSTGEVMGTGETFAEAYYKSQGLGALNIPLDGKAFISVREADKDALPELAKNYHDLGFTLVATKGTAKVISEAGIPVQAVNKVMEGRPHIVDMLKNDEIDLIVNTTEGRQAIADSATIRSTALRHGVYCTTTIASARAVYEALVFGGETSVNSLQHLHAEQLS